MHILARNYRSIIHIASTRLSYTATSKDHTNIIKYCIDNGAKVTDDVMKVLLINRAKETYVLLLSEQAVHINYYISWHGDILGDIVMSHDME